MQTWCRGPAGVPGPGTARPARFTAAFLLGALLSLPASSGAAESADGPLGFPQVARRVLEGNPRLAAGVLELEAVRTREIQADQAPAFEVGLEVENALGRADYRGFDGAEFTLALAAVFERGGKRAERRTAATAGAAVAALENRIEALDLLGEAGRRFLAVAGAEEQQRLARARRDQAGENRRAAADRVRDAAAPRTELLDAELRLAEAELALANGGRSLAAAREALAALWTAPGTSTAPSTGSSNGLSTGSGSAGEHSVVLDLYGLPEPRSYESLRNALAELPDLERYAADERLKSAELRLVRAQAVADWRWSLGVRHLEDTGDQALVAGFTVPLGEARRAAPRIREAELQQARTALARSDRARQLESLLHGQWQLLASARHTVQVITAELLPRAAEARELLARGYRIGRFPYRDLVLAEDRLAELESRRLAAALDHHAARIEIERLTGAHLTLLKD